MNAERTETDKRLLAAETRYWRVSEERAEGNRQGEEKCRKVGQDAWAEADEEMKGEEMKQISVQIYSTWLC